MTCVCRASFRLSTHHFLCACAISTLPLFFSFLLAFLFVASRACMLVVASSCSWMSVCSRSLFLASSRSTLTLATLCRLGFRLAVPLCISQAVTSPLTLLHPLHSSILFSLPPSPFSFFRFSLSSSFGWQRVPLSRVTKFGSSSLFLSLS